METETKRILLIEDNLGEAFFIKDMLKRLREIECKVTHVTRLEEGIARLEGCQMDLVLLDLKLPDAGSRGAETVRALSARCPNVPIVVLTNVDAREERVEVLKAGARDFLAKPALSAESLGRAVVAAMAPGHGGQPSSR